MSNGKQEISDAAGAAAGVTTGVVVRATLRTAVQDLVWRSVQDVVHDLCSHHRYDGYDELMAKLSESVYPNLIKSGSPRTDYKFAMLIVLTRTVNQFLGLADAIDSIDSIDLGKQIKTKIDALDTNLFGDVQVSKAMMTFNISLDYLVRRSLIMARDFANRTFMKQFAQTGDRKIVLDFSSPNVAKDMHVGHLRSTIIGDTLYRLLSVFHNKQNILCQNHIGDWGTQFGMIINLLRYEYGNLDSIMLYLDGADSNALLTIYRKAKTCFDNKEGNEAYVEFANESRHQTYCLQQGNTSDNSNDHVLHKENAVIWRKICELSRDAYTKIYRKLMITDQLQDRGESFYNDFIPGVLDLIKDLMYEESGAMMINLDGWEFPLIVVKSDGGYTYATTDIAAIWHRTQVIKADKLVYITDRGQGPHFDKVFDVALKMGWTTQTSQTTQTTQTQGQAMHIGFGLVAGPDGKKLKTRSGEVIKLNDVIDEVTEIAHDVISDRAARAKAGEDVHSGYADVDERAIANMSQMIGMNTLKYYDDSHLYSSGWRYDPKKMFEFQGDTGVYQMYCYCRIASIIEKSQYDSENTPQYLNDLVIGLSMLGEDDTVTVCPDFTDLTTIDRDLLCHLVQFADAMYDSYASYSIKPIMDYVKLLTTHFNRYVSKQNIKILGAPTEKYRFVICVLSHKILDTIFEILGFGKIDFI